MHQITKRLLPNQDLRREIEKFVRDNHVQAGVLLSIVGCLSQLRLRLADGKTVREWSDPFEIVSGTGTVSESDCHLHISASDTNGNTIGGHLKDGCVVGTTAEVVILVFSDVEYKREPDSTTGYDELVVKQRSRDRIEPSSL